MLFKKNNARTIEEQKYRVSVGQLHMGRAE